MEKYQLQKLFIGNIPHNSTEEELKEWVRSAGFPVESADIIRDRSTNQSRGFAFVVLQADARIDEAIRLLNGQRMNGRVLTVNHAVPPNSLSRTEGRGR